MVIVLIAFFILFAILERVVPLRQSTQPLRARWPQNITLGLVLLITTLMTTSPSIKHAMQWSYDHHFGLLHWFSLPVWLQIALGCLLMDLTFYYWHRINHEWSLLWRFHRVHHIDPDMDVTTAIRFHAIEIAYSSLFRILQLGLIGLQPLTFIIYEFMFQLSTYFQHANIRLPKNIEHALNWVFITPRIHGIHHSQNETERNKNYGSVFTVWDRLHGTWLDRVLQCDVKIGVVDFARLEDNRLLKLLSIPFE